MAEIMSRVWRGKCKIGIGLKNKGIANITELGKKILENKKFGRKNRNFLLRCSNLCNFGISEIFLVHPELY